MKTEIQETNKLIAEFMDGKLIDGTLYEFPQHPIFSYKSSLKWHLADMGFHTSWDWLMPVVGKIESSGFLVQIYKSIGGWEQCVIANAVYDHAEYFEGDKIQIVYSAICRFIQWYNTQLPNKGE